MEELPKIKDIFITNAEKIGAAVIMDIKDFTNKANQQLSAIQNYKTLQEGRTLQQSKSVSDIIESFKNVTFQKKNGRWTQISLSKSTRP